MKAILMTIFERMDQFIGDTIDIDGKVGAIMDLYYALPELAKIGIFLLALLIGFLGTLRLLKKVLIDLPKKLMMIVIFIAIVYVILVIL